MLNSERTMAQLHVDSARKGDVRSEPSVDGQANVIALGPDCSEEIVEEVADCACAGGGPVPTLSVAAWDCRLTSENGPRADIKPLSRISAYGNSEA